MSSKNKYAGLIAGICACIVFCCILLSSCSSDVKRTEFPIAMVKNTTLPVYGTGFAVGIPGEPIEHVVTSYSVVATKNGAAPQTAELRISEDQKKILAKVLFCDEGRNIAILKLPEKITSLKPVILADSVNYNEPVNISGYDGTGNIASNFETFNITDIVQYSGIISANDQMNTISVYKFSGEFNRAVAGAPALNENGNLVGMCSYSISGMNTYSQYILSVEELKMLLAAQHIEYITAGEFINKNIIILSAAVGILLFVSLLIAIFVTAFKKPAAAEQEKKTPVKEMYIRATGGTLNGCLYKLDKPMLIGRDYTKCDIVYPIKEPGISSVHCKVYIENNCCYVTDQGSSYGTFVNGNKLTPSTPCLLDDVNNTFYIADPKNRFEIINKKELEK